MSTAKESLREQSIRIKQKVNTEVEKVFDLVTSLHNLDENKNINKEIASSIITKTQRERSTKLDMLKKIKDAICE